MPLSSWTCDICGDEITDPELGLLTWREYDDMRAYDFVIVHKNFEGRTCDPGFERGYSSSVAISSGLGNEGQAYLLSMLSLGPIKGESDARCAVADFDQYVDVFRRLQTPWYEEARGRWADDDVQHWLGDANEVYPYVPDVLERIANRTL